jgi:hypothetical protein
MIETTRHVHFRHRGLPNRLLAGRMPPVRVMPVTEEWSLELPAPFAAALAICAGAATASMLILRRRAVAQSTLVPAWWWALAAALVWSITETAGALGGESSAHWLAPLRLAAAALSFCPMLAVLGAKRPQHAAWSFVVAALWAVVSLPAAEALLLQRGQRLEIGDVRGWFLWILIVVAPINYLPTRQWLAAALLAVGQTLALSEYLPLIRQPLFEGSYLGGLALAALAVTMVRRPGSRATSAYDRLWLDFRDLFGLFWALRLQERVNAVATTNQWPIDLGWSGLVDRERGRESLAETDTATGTTEPAKDSRPPWVAIEPTLRTTLRGLLRRFVSSRWIAERLARDNAEGVGSLWRD